VGESGLVAVDVWISDDSRNFRLLARVKGGALPENPSKSVAIRASEVLRARFFEAHIGNAQARGPAPAPSPIAPADEVDSEATRDAARLGFELGASAWASLDGVGPALLPLLRIDWQARSELILQATLAGFGTRPEVATTAGNAEVALQYGLLGACYRLGSQHRVGPLGALSLGALHTAVLGEAQPPRTGHSVEQWSLLLEASLGASVQLSRRYSLLFAAHAQLAEPYVAIHFGDQKVASLGRPNLLMSLTFGVWP